MVLIIMILMTIIGLILIIPASISRIVTYWLDLICAKSTTIGKTVPLQYITYSVTRYHYVHTCTSTGDEAEELLSSTVLGAI